MDLHQLRVFHAAVKSGGFSRAGEQLHLSQSTVSQHIKLLEQEVGCPLFLRVGKRVQVTEAGKVLLPYAERIFCDLKNAEMALREMNGVLSEYKRCRQALIPDSVLSRWVSKRW